MKRAISGDVRRRGQAMLGAAVLATLAACSAPTGQPVQPEPGASAWVTTPMIQSAARTPEGLVVRGMTAPSGRVVVRGSAGVAYATSADDQGRFVLKVAPVAIDTLFVVETQNGQDAAPAPYRLLLTRDPAGPIALLAPGGPSRRLDRAGPLDVIDSDGRSLLASGRGVAGSTISVAMDGQEARDLRTRPDGRWVAPMEAGSVEITVDGRRYVRPVMGEASAETPLIVSAAPGGKLVVWSASREAAQSSWFPDAP